MGGSAEALAALATLSLIATDARLEAPADASSGAAERVGPRRRDGGRRERDPSNGLAAESPDADEAADKRALAADETGLGSSTAPENPKRGPPSPGIWGGGGSCALPLGSDDADPSSSPPLARS